MSELVRAVHGYKQAQAELSTERLRNAELQSEIDRAMAREAELLRMLSAYQGPLRSSEASGRSGAEGYGPSSAASFAQAPLATGVQGVPTDALGVSLQAARVKLLEARVAELTTELSEIKLDRAAAAPSSLLASVRATASAESDRRPGGGLDRDATVLAKMFRLEQENNELKATAAQQQRQLASVQRALVDLGIGV
jgi:hypothetical protein